MGLLPNQHMNLVLSTDAKPRLKWTPELHQRFIEAVAQLGGADKATPKTLMRTMGIAGLTLYHLKSHLQKFRLGKSQESETYSDKSEQEDTVLVDADYKEDQSLEIQFNVGINDGTQIPVNESLKVAQALQMQMEVQRKLHEQIEVQRHLQLRIEAQGKYLQLVLKKAQETLAGYNSSSSSTGVEFARAELSHLVSMVNNTNCSSSLSELTDAVNSSFKVLEKTPIMIYTNGSKESSLTSSDSSSKKEEKRLKPKAEDAITLPSMAILQESHYQLASQDIGLSLSSNGRKRNGSTIGLSNCFLEQPSSKRPVTYESKDDNQFRLFGYAGTIDLNSRYQSIDTSSGPRSLDLNCKEAGQFNDHL